MNSEKEENSFIENAKSGHTLHGRGECYIWTHITYSQPNAMHNYLATCIESRKRKIAKKSLSLSYRSSTLSQLLTSELVESVQYVKSICVKPFAHSPTLSLTFIQQSRKVFYLYYFQSEPPFCHPPEHHPCRS